MNQEHPTFHDFFLSPLFHPQISPISQLSPLQSQQDQLNFTALEQLSSMELPGACFDKKPIENPLLEHMKPVLEQQSGSLKICAKNNVPFTDFVESKDQQLPFFQLDQSNHKTRVRQIIEFLIENSLLDQERVELEGRRFSGGDPQLLQVFRILSLKFRNLKKTKEEMTKYCMRKAFKFIGEPVLEASGCDVEEGMQEYFSANGGQSFSFPFKKHSIDKTMNGAFLARVFANQKFERDYRRFLDRFEILATEDNCRKIQYLCEQIHKAIKNEDLGPLQLIKRVPWTKRILNQLKQLAAELPENPREGRSRRPGKERFV